MIESKLAKITLIPKISEKSTRIQAINQYVFCVDNSVKKRDVAKMVEFVFHVNVTSVNLCRVKGKKCNFKNIPGKKQDWKKAYVTIKEGQTINMGGGV